MGPIRNPNWSTSGMRVTLSYLIHIHSAYTRKIYYSQNTVNLNDRLSNLQTHYKINRVMYVYRQTVAQIDFFLY
jgi:hypothetical protein